MKNILSFSGHIKEFFILLKKHGAYYFFRLALVYLAYYLNRHLFIYLLRLEIDNFQLYPNFYSWLLIGLHTLITIIITYFLFKLFLSLIKTLNSQKNIKSKFFDIFSFTTFFNYIFIIFIILLLSYNFSSNFKFIDSYFLYLAANSFESTASSFIYGNYLSVIILAILFLSLNNFFSIFKISNKETLSSRDLVRKISKAIYWRLVLRIALFILPLILITYFFNNFVYYLLSYTVILAFLLSFYLTPIYRHRVEIIDLNQIKKISNKLLTKISYYFLLSIAVITFIILNVVTLLNTASYKPIEVNHNDILPTFDEMPMEENAFVYFFDQEKIDNMSINQDNSHKSSKIISENYWEAEYVEETILENTDLLDHYIYTINNFSQWQNINNPCVSFEEKEITSYNPLRLASRLYSLKVLDYLNDNQIETAWSMALSKLQFTKNYSRSNDLLDLAVILSTKLENLKTLNKIIAHEDFSRIIDNSKVNSLMNVDYTKNDLLISSIKSEYCMHYYGTKDLFNSINQGLSYYIGDCNNQVAEYYRQLVRAASSPTYLEAREAMPDELSYDIDCSILYEKNSLCRIISNLYFSVYLDIIYRNMTSDVLYNLTVININWQKFRQENNRMPNSLSELELDEEYLIDLINDEMYHYDPDNSLVWSVGKNGINNEGSDDDIVLDLKTGIIN